MLINPITKRHIDAYLEQQFQTLILSGPTGSGKKQTVSYISSALFDVPIDEYHHAYIIDGTQDGIDKVREVKKQLTHSFAATNPDHKRIVVIFNLDKLSSEAIVALLKLIEEPPDNTLLIMTINDIGSIPRTILSRSKTIDVLPIDLDFAVKNLAEIYGTQDVEKIWYQSKGLAGKIANHEAQADDSDPNFIAKKFVSNKPSDRLMIVNELSKMDKSAQIEILKSISNILYYKFGVSFEQDGEKDNLIGKIEKLNELSVKLNANTNPKLIWTDLSLSL